MAILWLVFVLSNLFNIVHSFHFTGSTILGEDPQTVNRLNGESFQQDALVTFNGYQYAVFYESDSSNASIRHPCVSRRSLLATSKTGSWQKLTLADYNQTGDDGHDVISLGISHTDGTLHLGFDQHDNPFNYKISKKGIAINPSDVKWDAGVFGPTINYLPGLSTLDRSTHFINITYPRFLSIPSTALHQNADLLLEMRVGRSGLGDDWLYQYIPSKGEWELIGKYLEVNNAYINGLDFDLKGSLHATWTYRDYINDTGQDVAVEAGPNGPENNHDMDYAWSPNLGQTWLNTWGQQIALLSNTSDENSGDAADDSILPTSPGITVFSIPKYGGILNQESQTVDSDGRVHVLNRENGTGVETWWVIFLPKTIHGGSHITYYRYHYWRSSSNSSPVVWTRTPLPLPSSLSSRNNITGTPTVIGKRGKLITVPPNSKSNDTLVRLLAILPSNAPSSAGLSILQSTSKGSFKDWQVIWEAESGCEWEPLVDRYRLQDGDGKLSLFIVNGTKVEVWDFEV
ncbi:hypothetical protein C8Q75DRAFT_791033 [Abortiporus biennis]|nr:hypothetical protein C8Q75DRAFT_791033 [Abortiporus biennis]